MAGDAGVAIDVRRSLGIHVVLAQTGAPALAARARESSGHGQHGVRILEAAVAAAAANEIDIILGAC